MPKKAPRIHDEIWNRHKDAIVAYYSTNSLRQTMSYMLETHGFQASKSQYEARLKSWGVEKYHPGSDWAIVCSRIRKRSHEGKESDVYVRGRKYTGKEIKKEIARHVFLNAELSSSESVLPEYITVCTPVAEEIDFPGSGMSRDMLLRGLPWYEYTQALQTLTSREFRGRSAFSTITCTLLEIVTGELPPHFDSDSTEIQLPQLSVFAGRSEVDAYLPGKLDFGELSTRNPNIIRIFLGCFVSLSVNSLLTQLDFDKIFDWIVGVGGEIILVYLCFLEFPFMQIFAEKVFSSAVRSGNVCLCRTLLETEKRLQPDNPFQRQRWAEYVSHAVGQKHETMVKLLCEAGVRPEVTSKQFWGGDWDLQMPILQILLDHGADPERFFTREQAGFPLIDAALNGSLKAVELLLGRGARVNLHLPRYYGTALQAAASRSHLDVVKYLILHGADIDVPCGLEIQIGHCSILEDNNKNSLLTPVQIAAKMNNAKLLQTLLQHGASAKACPVSTCLNLQDLSDPTVDDLHIPQRRHKTQKNSKDLFCTALQYGALNQNLEIIALLLSTGVAPDSRIAPDIGDTPLQISTRLGNLHMFQLLRSWGADVNAPPAACNGRTALQGAAERGDWEILRMLLRTDAHVNASAGIKRGLTALQAACLKGHSRVALALLVHGADLNTSGSAVAGLTAIQAAVTDGDIKLVKCLLTLGAEVNTPATEEGTTALLSAVRNESLPMLKLLVQNGADVNATAQYGFLSPLTEAASRSWLEGVQFLLEYGANVNGPPFDLAMSNKNKEYAPEALLSPLGWAIVCASQDMVKLLLQYGANVSATVDFNGGITPQSALLRAISEESISCQILDMLFAEAPRLEEHPGWEGALLYGLVYNPHIDISALQRILEKVGSLPASLRHTVVQNAWDQLPPPFYYLSSDHHIADTTVLEIIELLMRLGANLDSRSGDGSTLLLRATCDRHHKCCNFLVDRGASINIEATKSWGTPLQEAIRNSHVDLANVLLDHGADINASPAEDNGTTALQAASINGLFELAMRLLENGADVAAPAAPIEGWTAIDGAAKNGRLDMVKLLLNAYGDEVDLEPICCQAADHAEDEGHFVLARWLRGYTAG